MADHASKQPQPGEPAAPASTAAVEAAASVTAPIDAAAEPVDPIVEPLPSVANETFGAPPEASAPASAGARAATIALPELGGSAAAAAGKHFGLLLDVGVEVAAVVGSRELKLEQVLAIQPGSIIDLDKHAGEPIELYVNGKPIALAEVVVIDGRLGARVVETLATPSDP